MTVMDEPRIAADAAPPPGPQTGEVEARWQAGDPDALRLAFDAWGGAIHSYCVRRLPPGEAADATQEVFVAAWRARHQYDAQRGSLGQWLFGIARNTCIGFHRRGARVPVPVEQVPVAVAATAPSSDDQLSDRLLLAGALQQLPQRQQQVLRASFVDGWTNQEVAERLGVPLGTVKSDIRRGLRTLRDQLEGSR